MIKRLFFAVLFLVALIPAEAAAMPVSVSDTVTLIGTVPVARYIYLDKNGDVDKVVGNTSNDAITPTIASQNLTPLSSKIISQYQAILKENGGHMAAGATYYSDKTSPYKQFAKLLIDNSYFNSKPF